MKRSNITKKKTKRLSDYDAEFARMKSIVRERSRGKCEALNVAVAYVMGPNADFDSASTLTEFIEWHEINCRGRADHCHHRKYRVRGGTNASSNLVDLSIDCHAWAHAHGGFTQPANLIGLALSARESEKL